MKYAYYPGCSLESGSAAYDVSVRAIADVLGIELEELDDWNCCGATEYFTQDELVATSVIARNLALVDGGHTELVAPCAACFLNLKKTDTLMCDSSEMTYLRDIERLLGMDLSVDREHPYHQERAQRYSQANGSAPRPKGSGSRAGGPGTSGARPNSRSRGRRYPAHTASRSRGPQAQKKR